MNLKQEEKNHVPQGGIKPGFEGQVAKKILNGI